MARCENCIDDKGLFCSDTVCIKEELVKSKVKLTHQGEFDYRPKKNFWKETPFGRTLSLRNKTGKTIAGLATGGIALLTGVDVAPFIQTLTGIEQMEAFTDITLIEVIVGILALALTAGVTWAQSYWKLPSVLVSKIQLFIEVFSEEIVEATRAESEGGSKITANERRKIARECFKQVFGQEIDQIKDIKP